MGNLDKPSFTVQRRGCFRCPSWGRGSTLSAAGALGSCRGLRRVRCARGRGEHVIGRRRLGKLPWPTTCASCSLAARELHTAHRAAVVAGRELCEDQAYDISYDISDDISPTEGMSQSGERAELCKAQAYDISYDISLIEGMSQSGERAALCEAQVYGISQFEGARGNSVKLKRMPCPSLKERGRMQRDTAAAADRSPDEVA